MKTLLFTCCLFAAVALAPAQNPASAPAPSGAPTVRIDKKNGPSVEVTSLRRSGSSVMVPLPDGSGEIGIPRDTITRINFPEPGQIREADELLSVGKFEDALRKIEPIVAFHAPLRDIPGNFWLPAAFIKMKSLIALQRTAEASSLLDLIGASAKGDPLIEDRVQVEKAAVLTRTGKDQQALALYEEIIKRSNDPDTLAGAWLNKGRSLLALKQYDPAVMAFLYLPVFASSQTTLLPAALLGSARAWQGLERNDEARPAFQEVIDQYPQSPEAEAAKKEINLLKKS